MAKSREQMTVALDPALREQIERRAREQDRSLGAEIRVLLNQALRAAEEQRPQAT